MIDRKSIEKMDKSDKLIRVSMNTAGYVCPVCGARELFPCSHFFVFDMQTYAAYYWKDPKDTEDFDV